MINLELHQEQVERKFSRRNINQTIMDDLNSNPAIQVKVSEAVGFILEYMGQTYWDTKSVRIEHLMTRDLDEIVTYILCIITPTYGRTELYTSVVGQLAGMLKYPDPVDGLRTAAELIAVVSDTGLYGIRRARDTGSGMMEVRSKVQLSEDTLKYIKETMYLPPMVCEPNIVTNNYTPAHKTFESDSVICGHKLNSHNDNVSLDVINKLNQTKLSLNVDLLKTFSDTVPESIEDLEAREQFTAMIEKSYEVYKDLVALGNKFWMTHKFDSRGRFYSQGYHCNYQGNSFRKAIVQLEKKEFIPID